MPLDKNIITKEELENAHMDAETIGHFVNDPPDIVNPGHPNGTLITRTGALIYNLQKLVRDFGKHEIPDSVLADMFLSVDEDSAPYWDMVNYELVALSNEHPVSEEPFNEGDFYYSLDDYHLYQYIGGTWVQQGFPKKGRNYWCNGITYRWNGEILSIKDSYVTTLAWPRPQTIMNGDVSQSNNETLYTNLVACVLNPHADLILLPGQLGFEPDTGVFKVGNGVLPWSELEFQSGKGGGYNIQFFMGAAGTFEFQVPVGVDTIYVTAIGGGSSVPSLYITSEGSNYNAYYGSYGSSTYRQKLSVTPLDYVMITIGAGGRKAPATGSGSSAWNAAGGDTSVAGVITAKGAPQSKYGPSGTPTLPSTIVALFGDRAVCAGGPGARGAKTNDPIIDPSTNTYERGKYGCPGAVAIEWGLNIS